jgi:uncharacterized protein YaaQ
MAATETVNQLIFLTAAASQVGDLTDRLTRDNFHFTHINQSGFFDEAAVSLLIGLDKARWPQLLEHVRAACHVRRHFIPANLEAPPLVLQTTLVEAEVGGAVVYALDVERFEQL